ncbi:MAG TPA: BlaI/MecI/CopY family transcriptional regulator [Acidobacteriota bacterium]|nr:BlaI/MecI/CopY family transcriptional regulator [Acidobacteriota bacterium]
MRKKSPTLTEAELRLMDILWENGESTVAEVVEALSRHSPLAYSTVLTTLRILEQKKYVSHKKSGRAFLYYPVVERGQARQKVIDYVLSRFFNNSPELLVLNVLEREKIQPRELQHLKKKIQESE